MINLDCIEDIENIVNAVSSIPNLVELIRSVLPRDTYVRLEIGLCGSCIHVVKHSKHGPETVIDELTKLQSDPESVKVHIVALIKTLYEMKQDEINQEDYE